MNYLTELEKIRDTLMMEFLGKKALGFDLSADYIYEEYLAVQKAIKRIEKIQKHSRKTMGDYISGQQVENNYKEEQNNVF